MKYNLETIEELKKTFTWKEIAAKYEKEMLTVQKFYFRKKRELNDKNGNIEPIKKPKQQDKEKTIDFYRFFWRELTGAVSRSETKPELMSKIAKELNKRAKQLS